MVASFTDSTQIRRKTAITADGAGGQKPTSGDGYSTVATVFGLLTTTRYQPQERGMANQVVAVVTYKWYGPAGTDIRQQDRVIVDSRTFEVKGVSVDTSGMPLEAQLSEIQRGQAIA